MSKNIHQIYIDNPATSLQTTDLFYLGRSPYGIGNDMACLFSVLQTGLLTPWVNVAVGTVTLAINSGFLANDGASVVNCTLPTTAAVGSIIEIYAVGTGGFSVLQLAGQQIFMGIKSTTLGIGGSLSSTNKGDYVKLLCIVANTNFAVIGGVGNLTIV